MADADKGMRGGGLFMLSVMCVAMVATQLSYVVVGNAHMMCVLAPVAATSLLFGTVAGTCVGALAGLAEMIHAALIPLDVYERYFAAPWNSLTLLALVGFFMGLLYAYVDRWRGQGGWKRPAALAVCCAMGSALFSILFAQSAYLINSLVTLTVPTEIAAQFANSKEFLSQALANFGLMAILSIGADAVNERRLAANGAHTMRETFQGWLFVVVAIGYMVVASFTYTFVTVASRGAAEQTLQGQLEYLEGQLSERDKLIDSFSRRTSATPAVMEEVHASTVAGVATGLELGEGGVAAVAEDGTIVSSNVGSYVGRDFADVVGEGLADGFDEGIFESSRSVDWYMGGDEMGFLRAGKMGYVRVAKSGDYQVMVAMSSAEVFRYRAMVMALISVAFLLVFASMYAQAGILLREVVVRGFERTNEALKRITGGDLDEVVNVDSTTEFQTLSLGINSTVGSLKDSLEKTKEAIERELATAKAIQRSALPSTFPPFPEVEAFDLYASMNAAKEVGGDFYDFFLIDDHTLGFLIADVSGKGIPASLFMMTAKTELENYMSTGMPLAEAVSTANHHLCQGNEAGMFVTVWAATLDWETGELTYVNAGHNPPLLRHEGTWEWLTKKGGLFLGTFEKAKYRSATLTMEKGDEILLYTDGVNEAFSADEEEYGNGRLEALLGKHTADHPRVLIDAVRHDLAAWAEGAEQSDDITMLGLRYLGNTSLS